VFKSIKIIKNSDDVLNFRSIIELLLLIIVVEFLLKACVLDIFVVSSGYMEPVLQKNDYVIVSRLAYCIGLSSKLPIKNLKIKSIFKRKSIFTIKKNFNVFVFIFFLVFNNIKEFQ
jgi:signal peptidase I